MKIETEKELELDWPPVITTPISPDQLHLHKQSTIQLLGTNRHPQSVSAGDFLFLGNNVPANEGKEDELMLH